MDNIEKIFEDFDEDDEDITYIVIKNARKIKFHLYNNENHTILSDDFTEKRKSFRMKKSLSDGIKELVINGSLLINDKFTYKELIDRGFNIGFYTHICNPIDFGDYEMCTSCGKTTYYV